jgi:hypothetical protein
MKHSEYFHFKSFTWSLSRTFDGHLYTICGPQSLCRPSTLHHLNQLRSFARPSNYWPNSPIWPKHTCFIFAAWWHGRRQSVSRTGSVCCLLQSISRSESANKLYWVTTVLTTVWHFLSTDSQLLSSATRSYDVHASGSASSNWNCKLQPLPLDNDNYPSVSMSIFAHRKRAWLYSWPSST